MRGGRVSCRARRRLLIPTVGSADKARTLALRPTWVASLLVSVTVTLAVVGGLDWTGADANPAIPADTAVIQVGAGETVWDVAQRVAPRSDPRAVVQRIRQLNALKGSAIAPGQQLQVPDGR
ncbi:MAG: LysM peptidoglycan-binding domain-containing protein [Actinomycetota bacterium]|nr:LysM peptidoglycan-binding domain-containing protein [Actinomycetota bacterium]